MAVPALCATRAGIIVMSVLALAITACTSSAAEDSGDQPSQVGNVIFLHPDGTGLNSWNVARAYWKGPDGALAWDELPEMAAYRGHMEDVATGTSNGGATTHAFGYKVDSPGSFGKDGDGEAQPPTDRFINSLSGYQGSIMREAANNGHPVGVVNDGMIAEPGTGAFLAEVSSRDDTTGISQQILLGRPNSTDTAPHVILGGGEADFVPENTPRCAPDATTLDCRVHEVAEGDGSTTTGRLWWAPSTQSPHCRGGACPTESDGDGRCCGRLSHSRCSPTPPSGFSAATTFRSSTSANSSCCSR